MDVEEPDDGSKPRKYWDIDKLEILDHNIMQRKDDPVGYRLTLVQDPQDKSMRRVIIAPAKDPYDQLYVSKPIPATMLKVVATEERTTFFIQTGITYTDTSESQSKDHAPFYKIHFYDGGEYRIDGVERLHYLTDLSPVCNHVYLPTTTLGRYTGGIAQELLCPECGSTKWVKAKILDLSDDVVITDSI